MDTSKTAANKLASLLQQIQRQPISFSPGAFKADQLMNQASKFREDAYGLPMPKPRAALGRQDLGPALGALLARALGVATDRDLAEFGTSYVQTKQQRSAQQYQGDLNQFELKRQGLLDKAQDYSGRAGVSENRAQQDLHWRRQLQLDRDNKVKEERDLKDYGMRLADELMQLKSHKPDEYILALGRERGADMAYLEKRLRNEKPSLNLDFGNLNLIKDPNMPEQEGPILIGDLSGLYLKTNESAYNVLKKKQYTKDEFRGAQREHDLFIGRAKTELDKVNNRLSELSDYSQQFRYDPEATAQINLMIARAERTRNELYKAIVFAGNRLGALDEHWDPLRLIAGKPVPMPLQRIKPDLLGGRVPLSDQHRIGGRRSMDPPERGY